MIRVTDFEQLENMTIRLFVEVVCPKCETVILSTMVNAEKILVFGCTNCANVDASTLISFDNYPVASSPEVANVTTG